MHGKHLLHVVAGIAVLSLGVFVAPGVAEAQSADRPVGFGVKGAWTRSTFRADLFADDGTLVDLESGQGFSIGGLLAFDATPNVTIQPEFIYSKKKINANFTSEGLPGTGEIDTRWVEIPMMVKLHGSRQRAARPFVIVGVTLSFLVSAEQTLSAMGMTVVEDIEDELEGTDVGFTIGAGVDFSRDWGVFTVDARYSSGLRNLSNDGDVRQDTISVGAAFIF